ncbi:MAG: selenide, water dikinase SelD [Gammaproteobacteria bacterium]|nr:selenide, water dikinase SelD [Gammaproteobacteria bacterium]
MQSTRITPQVKHLVLIGGGHSHLFVLKRLGMRPVPGLTVTLISRDIDTPYSGAMPSYLSGFCSEDAMHIDLRPLAQFAGARLIRASVDEIDLEAKTIQLPGRPLIHFDLLSINTGSQPDTAQIDGAEANACPVKPISHFLSRWERVRAEATKRVSQQTPYSIVIVGGGPASVELALAMHYRIHRDCNLPLDEKSSLSLTLVGSASSLLAQHGRRVQQHVLNTLTERHINVALGQRVQRFLPDSVHTQTGADYDSDASFFATGARLPEWPGRCGLALSDDGFIDTLPTLQSANVDFVFVAGDAATIRGAARPKSGVYAVRAGAVLAENLVRFATGKRLKHFTPQQQALALISLGDKTAIASRGSLMASGRAVWEVKRRIDSRFVTKFTHLPKMAVDLDLTAGLVDSQTEATLRQHALRCAGCGAKVASGVLSDVLDELADDGAPRKPIEDAAIIPLANGRVLLQSIDQLSAFINDPWTFARVATNHCLSDIFAMGAQPHSALAVVGMPLASPAMTRRDLGELMRGVKMTLQENDCELLGGHTAENPTLQLGLAVNGFAEASDVLSKHAVNRAEVLILTKPLGSGVLFAADMRGRCRSGWAEAAIGQMLQSNRVASQLFVRHGATACTDVTGFGLAGHLFEMIDPTAAEVELDLNAVPALEGSLTLLAEGFQSSLHGGNRRVATGIYNQEAFDKNPRLELLFDPQTAGGLLAAVPEQAAAECLADLQQSGLRQAAIVGRVTSLTSGLPSIVLKAPRG